MIGPRGQWSVVSGQWSVKSVTVCYSMSSFFEREPFEPLQPFQPFEPFEPFSRSSRSSRLNDFKFLIHHSQFCLCATKITTLNYRFQIHHSLFTAN
jgi:hypothetical protein